MQPIFVSCITIQLFRRLNLSLLSVRNALLCPLKIAPKHDTKICYPSIAAVAKGYEDCPEGGARCMRCYRQRLEKTAALAKEMGFDYFCTTLSISPLKDAQKINAIGQSVGEQYGVAWLPSDFKKQERYKRSIALSREYGLYRQNFCGCVYSKQEKEKPV